NVYFTESNTAHKVCMRDRQRDGGSDSPLCSKDGAVKKYRDKRRRAALHRREMTTLNQLLE
ncbi:hypothetical protein, partial [Pantoea vagans]|uniref:hypothetical protein n=1 Tax=Pantoea vagans TaxID=470934 RepID=UPI001C9D0490